MEKLVTIVGGSRSVDAWEYKALGMWIDLGDVEQEINQLGDKGWELTGVLPTSQLQYTMFYFKRPNGFAQVEHDAAGRNLKGKQ